MTYLLADLRCEGGKFAVQEGCNERMARRIPIIAVTIAVTVLSFAGVVVDPVERGFACALPGVT